MVWKGKNVTLCVDSKGYKAHIQTRGHSSTYFPKQQYNLELVGKPAFSLLGLPPASAQRPQ